MTGTLATIPVLSLASLRRRDAGVVAKLGHALEEFGFVAVTDHGVDPDLLDDAYGLAAQTFAGSEETKRRYEDVEGGRQRGYTSVGVEHAKDRTVGDLKEFWHVGRTQGDVPKNIFPTEVARFEQTFTRLFSALDKVATDLLEAIGAHLGLEPGFFIDLTREGNSVLRVIHYPPQLEGTPAGAVRAAAHEDINLITVLPVSTAPGLQLMTRDRTWMDVETPPNVMVCDTGDMMQLLTDRRLPSTTHRVVNPSGADAERSRYSLPFFCHPRPDAVLRAGGAGVPEILANDFLMERLRDIGLA